MVQAQRGHRPTRLLNPKDVRPTPPVRSSSAQCRYVNHFAANSGQRPDYSPDGRSVAGRLAAPYRSRFPILTPIWPRKRQKAPACAGALVSTGRGRLSSWPRPANAGMTTSWSRPPQRPLCSPTSSEARAGSGESEPDASPSEPDASPVVCRPSEGQRL